MADEQYTVRLMEEADIAPIAQCFESLDRIPVGLNEVMLRTDWNTSPEGCIVAVNPAGKIICQCVTAAANENEAYLVFYRTEEAYRGKGIGSKVFRASFDAMQQRNVALTSREPMTSKYLRADFRCYGFGIYNLVFARNPEKSRSEREAKNNYELKTVDASMYKDVYSYLNSVVQMPESEFQQVFLKISSHVTAAIKDGAVVGFGAVQKTREDFRITPVYADSKEILESLLGHLASQIPDGSTVAIPLPAENREFVQQLVEGMGFSLQSEAFIDKIYSKRKVELNFDRVFSFWNFESVYQ